MSSGNHTNKLLAVCIMLSLAVLTADYYTPLGIATGMNYAAVVLLTIWMRGKNYTLLFSVLSTLLIVAGGFLSPDGDLVNIYLTNRIFSILMIWTAAFIILKFKSSESAARRDNERLHALFEHATEGIIISDTTGQIIMANPKAAEIFGYGANELLKKKIEALVPAQFRQHHPKHRASFHANPVARPMGLGRDLLGQRKDGSHFPIEISISSYVLDNKRYVLAFVIDITQRKKQDDLLKKAKLELEQYTEILKETNAELENFAYISSHDLQEPLRKIQSFGDILKEEESASLTEEGNAYLERILDAASRMQRLINDLLTFSRLTSRAKAFEPVNLNQIINEVISDLEIAVTESSAKIEIDDMPVIDAEPTQMRQLFQNLIGNAIKFRKDGQNPEIRITAELVDHGDDFRDKMGEFVQIKVEDQGSGFDEKYLDKIFSIFQRLNGKKYEGSGIGLAICKKIVSRHRGEISARSKPDQGATFIVTLPVRQNKAENLDFQKEPIKIQES